MTIVTIPHPRGCIEHDMVLNADEANELYEQLHDKIGRMPVKV